ncbi:Carb anhydrase domain containing protein, partial [Asbolus verrucosus]
DEVEVKRLSVRGLLPETDYYMTYDGSTTMPACHETVTWLILNKPIYITKQQVRSGVTFNTPITPNDGANPYTTFDCHTRLASPFTNTNREQSNPFFRNYYEINNCYKLRQTLIVTGRASRILLMIKQADG